MRYLLLLIAFTAMLVSSGCASLSKEQCLSGDWEKIGYKDGSRGYKAAGRLQQHGKSCSEHGIAVNRDLYLAGHANGLTIYCSPANGRSLGEQGTRYNGVCPASLEAAFLAQYDYGQRIHAAVDEYNDIKSQLEAREKALQVEPNARARDAIRSEIATLDRLLLNQDREIQRLRAEAPPY